MGIRRQTATKGPWRAYADGGIIEAGDAGRRARPRPAVQCARDGDREEVRDGVDQVHPSTFWLSETGQTGLPQTDKAADPISAMGASKAMAELVVRDVGHRYPDTHFCSVRFGNVLGSRGSVVPIFRRQIEIGGPVTVTHPEMTRYVMSISEAVQLVLQAASMAGDPSHRGGVFILSMGEPVRILDVAHTMISFAKNGHSSDIEIAYTGLRPGERMHEMLVGSQERSEPTAHPLIDVLRPAPHAAAPDGAAADGATIHGAGDIGPGHADFRNRVELLLALGEAHADRAAVIDGLCTFIPTYRPSLLAESGPFGSGRGKVPRHEEAAGHEQAAVAGGAEPQGGAGAAVPGAVG